MVRTIVFGRGQESLRSGDFVRTLAFEEHSLTFYDLASNITIAMSMGHIAADPQPGVLDRGVLDPGSSGPWEFWTWTSLLRCERSN